MSVWENCAISSNEHDDTPPLEIDTTPHNPAQYDGISDAEEPSQPPLHPYNTNFSP